MIQQGYRCSIVIPAKNESADIERILERINSEVNFPFECVVVVDSEEDTTLPILKNFMKKNVNFKVVFNRFHRGPSGALLTGISLAKSRIVVVTMADGSDDPSQISDLVLLVERGVAIACASRYMAGGQAIGAPRFKGFLSKLCGKSLYILRNAGTHDATNNFKAYDKDFLDSIKIESEHGFEMGLEIVAKAIRRKKPIAEIPTIWIERMSGETKFKLLKWLPKYLKWYAFAFYGKVSTLV